MGNLEGTPISCSDTLMVCCQCKSTMQEPVQLRCLHSCCRRCLSSTSNSDNSNDVMCPSCNHVTKACDVEPSTFIDYLIRGSLAMAEMKVCTICKENGDAHALALEWCGSCRQSLCEECVVAHKRLNRNHCTEDIDELTSLENARTQVSSPTCSLHNRPLEFACFTCQRAKCLHCWAACNKDKHEMDLMSEDSFEVRLKALKSEILSMEQKLLTKSDIVKECKTFPSELKSSRADHLEKMQQRKRIILDAIENMYQEIEHSAKSIYDRVEMEAGNTADVATRLESNLSFSRNYVHRLINSNRHCDLWNQQKTLRSRLASLSAELDKLRTSMKNSKSVRMEPMLPENLEYIVRSWIGEPRICIAHTTAQQRPKLVCALSGCIQLPHNCHDIDWTENGNLLLAADEHGLLEFCTSGHEVSTWKPQKKAWPEKADKVLAVCALHEGQVAVGLFDSATVLLLHKRSLGSQRPKYWEQFRSLANLHSPARCLAVNGDVLAVAEWRFDGLNSNWHPGPQLELMRLTSGIRWVTFRRQYIIGSIAVTEREIITSSNGKVVLNSSRPFAERAPVHSREVFVIDGYNSSNEMLWRYELQNEDEVICSIFPNIAARALYVSFHKSDGSSGRVAAISLEDKSELQQHVLKFDGRRLPVRFSLDSSGTVIASLCFEAELKEQRTATLHMIS